MPLTHRSFHALIGGHCAAGDVDAAKAVLDKMREAGLEPRAATHVALITGN